MKTRVYQSIVLGVIGLFLICAGALLFFKNNNSSENTQIANPASVFCEEHGGTLEIRTDSDGSQTGYCIFENGKECEEWKFFRDECKSE